MKDSERVKQLIQFWPWSEPMTVFEMDFDLAKNSYDLPTANWILAFKDRRKKLTEVLLLAKLDGLVTLRGNKWDKNRSAGR
jgi:hypothetical protein